MLSKEMSRRLLGSRCEFINMLLCLFPQHGYGIWWNSLIRSRYLSRWAMTKVVNLRDPVHDLIRIECPLVIELMESQAFQRLRRIR